VLVVEIDGVDPEPLQGAVDDLLDDLRTARDLPPGRALDRIDIPPNLVAITTWPL
jgi:hypothetical protein